MGKIPKATSTIMGLLERISNPIRSFACHKPTRFFNTRPQKSGFLRVDISKDLKEFI
jgi:hypothetical protein